MCVRFQRALLALTMIIGVIPASSSLAQNKRAALDAGKVDSLSTLAQGRSATGKTQIALLTLPEVLPPWKQVDYDVRLEFFKGGANNLCYCVRHLENMCHNCGLPVRRVDIAGLGSLNNAILLVPDASKMLPGTRKALNDWIAAGKPTIIFGQVPADWARQHGVDAMELKTNSRKLDAIYFPADRQSIRGRPLQYVSYVAKHPVAVLRAPRDTADGDTVGCRQGSLLFWGWSPRPHAWAIVAEQDEYRLFARLLKEFQLDVHVPVIPTQRISNLKEFGIADWGIWPGWGPYDPFFKDLLPSLAGYGFDHVYYLGTYHNNMIMNKFAEKFLGTSPASPSQASSSTRVLRNLPAIIKKGKDCGLKVYAVVNPFDVRNRRLADALFKHDGLMYRYTDGKLVRSEYWSPADPELKRLAVESIKEFLTEQRVDGIFIDFARYLDSNFDYGPAMRQAFEKHVGRHFSDWPGAVINDPAAALQFAAFKRQANDRLLRGLWSGRQAGAEGHCHRSPDVLGLLAGAGRSV